jgi:hypothetical protein
MNNVIMLRNITVNPLCTTNKNALRKKAKKKRKMGWEHSSSGRVPA